MFGFRSDRAMIEEVTRRVVDDALKNAAKTLDRYADVQRLQDTVTTLKEQIETLRIEKGRKEEEMAKKEREIEHKVGLEKKRQEFEVEQAKRETTVSLREENLKADRDRFEKETKFTTDRFEKEVGYLKDMVGSVLERLPTAEIIATVGGK